MLGLLLAAALTCPTGSIPSPRGCIEPKQTITVVVHMCKKYNDGVVLCKEDIAIVDEMTMTYCKIGAQAPLAQWKMKSKYKDDSWYFGGWDCQPGSTYVIKDQT